MAFPFQRLLRRLRRKRFEADMAAEMQSHLELQAAANRAAGMDADALPVGAVRDPSSYDAYVVGAASYLFHWMKEARGFVHRHRRVLASRPVWTFSSGPVGTDTVDKDGRDVLETCLPREMPEIDREIGARGHRVFYGAFDPSFRPRGVAEHLMWRMPAARNAFPKGDFRDWDAIDAWADGIARELSQAEPARS